MRTALNPRAFLEASVVACYTFYLYRLQTLDQACLILGLTFARPQGHQENLLVLCSSFPDG